MKLKPLRDRIIVKRVEAEDPAEGALIIPDTAKEKPQQGVVKAVGEGRILENGKRIEMHVAEGDRILFGKYSGAEIKIEGEEFLILQPDEVLAVLDDTSLPGKPPGSDYPKSKPKTRVK